VTSPDYVSVWAIESRVRPGSVGWWVICGELPTDYVSAAEIKHPRKAVLAFAGRWQAYCDAVRSGAPPPEFTIEPADRAPVDLVPLLEGRAKTLAGWAADARYGRGCRVRAASRPGGRHDPNASSTWSTSIHEEAVRFQSCAAQSIRKTDQAAGDDPS